MKIYKGKVDFISNLLTTLDKDDLDLPIYNHDLATLAKAIGNNGYTFLRITDGTKTEIIKAEYIAGEIVIERGKDGTEPTTFPEGSEVKWILTSGAVRDIVCQMDCCPEKTDGSVAVGLG